MSSPPQTSKMEESDKASTIVPPVSDDNGNTRSSEKGSIPSSSSENLPSDQTIVEEMNTSTVITANGSADVEKAIPEAPVATKRVPVGYKEYDDPNIVYWDGPDDPAHPENWSSIKKVVIVSCVGLITLLTPLGSSMFAPGVGEVMKEFNSTNPELASFVVSVYLLGFSFGPLIIAPLSEMYGRAPLYTICNILFVVFNVACALANSLESLIVFRFFAGTAGSAPLTIGAGTISDMIRQEKRGGALAAWALGPLLGPVIGPVAGAFLTQALGWRWTFWVLSIASGVVALNTFIWLNESYHPAILARKTKRLIKKTGNTNLRSALDSGQKPKDLFFQSIVRPTKMLFLSPIVFLLSLYAAVVYGYLYLLFTTISGVFIGKYHFSQGTVGLSFLGIGIGCLLGLGVLGTTSDRLLKSLAARNGGVMKPEYRLPPLIPGSLFIPVGLFWYGWSSEKGVHYVIPIIGTAFVGIGMIFTFMTISTYLVDAYTRHSASALAANSVLRSIFGAVLPLCGQRMYKALGLGWGNSLLAFIALALAPLPIVFYVYGERIRTSKRFTVIL
ncbi:MFS multidrug transporter, putative [Trichophyton verrucosum HKI 0517]|uniref:MFS multidrug transporter, putative n=1 Tax=Trichophyton verrucosum (strain HKI 0517) TaxID=663202 RepID=D4DFB9_TRIVH|nr:MFS multidrug transporter, putative [Trichophyton verrucosum HKI 0517]EFE39468.1 MFS multidrug transporter, putative [Trichophyton verrucosum HKI 0517]